jgi:hypothetical protein
MFYLLTVQPFGHIPTDMIVRLQFHIIVPCNEINLSRNGRLFEVIALFLKGEFFLWRGGLMHKEMWGGGKGAATQFI